MTWDGKDRRVESDSDIKPDGKYHDVEGKYDNGDCMTHNPIYTKWHDEMVKSSGGRLEFINDAGQVHDGMNGFLYIHAIRVIERRKTSK